MNIVNFKIHLPVSFCEFSIRNNFFAPLRLYVYLKAVCAGQIKLDASTKMKIANELGVGIKTINNQLSKLEERNWVGYNPATGNYFIRGFNKITDIEKLYGRQGIRIDVSKDIRVKTRFKALVLGAIIGHLANVSKYKERERHKPEQSKWSSNHRLRHTAPSHFPVACHALASILNISISTASLHKRQAAEYGFIQVEKKILRYPLTRNPNKCDAGYAAGYKASHPEIAHRVRIINSKVYLQEADQVRPCLSYVKRRYSKK